MTTTVKLKLWPVFFKDAHRKPFELRRNDRGFQVGYVLHLCEWDPEIYAAKLEEFGDAKDTEAANVAAYTGRECMREVIYVLPEGSPGLAEGHVGLGLGPWFGVPRPATVDESEALRWAATWEQRR